MKNTTALLPLVLLLCLLPVKNIAWAGDSESFTVSCTIPSIPGVNAPLLENENTVKETPAINQDQKSQQQTQETDQQSEAPIYLAAYSGTESVLLKTLYPQ